jgi:acyl carrier protein
MAGSVQLSPHPPDPRPLGLLRIALTRTSGWGTPKPEEAPAAAATEPRAAHDVRALPARITGVSPAAITRSGRLGTNLGLDSLGLTDLVALLERELGCTVPFEALVGSDPSEDELQQMFEARDDAGFKDLLSRPRIGRISPSAPQPR